MRGPDPRPVRGGARGGVYHLRQQGWAYGTVGMHNSIEAVDQMLRDQVRGLGVHQPWVSGRGKAPSLAAVNQLAYRQRLKQGNSCCARRGGPLTLAPRRPTLRNPQGANKPTTTTTTTTTTRFMGITHYHDLEQEAKTTSCFRAGRRGDECQGAPGSTPLSSSRGS